MTIVTRDIAATAEQRAAHLSKIPDPERRAFVEAHGIAFIDKDGTRYRPHGSAPIPRTTIAKAAPAPVPTSVVTSSIAKATPVQSLATPKRDAGCEVLAEIAKMSESTAVDAELRAIENLSAPDVLTPVVPAVRLAGKSTLEDEAFLRDVRALGAGQEVR